MYADIGLSQQAFHNRARPAKARAMLQASVCRECPELLLVPADCFKIVAAQGSIRAARLVSEQDDE